jgi:tripartite-type tricarboxylate transporter receptor subunit TctC
MTRFFRTASLFLAATLGGLSAPTAMAQDYPSRTVRVMVGFPPGGSVDIVGRVLSEKLATQMGQPFVVENRPGAIGTLAMNAMRTVAPDGYTILLGTNPQVRPGMDESSEPYRDLVPIALTTVIPIALLANPQFSARTPQDFVMLARDSAQPLAFATPGAGSPMELAMLALKGNLGLNLMHVPYNGGPPAVNDTVAGQVPLIAVGLPTALAQVNAGKLRPILVLQNQRTDLLPGTPSMREALGTTGSDLVVWLGFFAPAKTPAAILKRLEDEVGIALNDANVRARLASAALEVRFAPAPRLADLVREQNLATLDAMKRYGSANK